MLGYILEKYYSFFYSLQNCQFTHETAEVLIAYFKIIQDDDCTSDVEVRMIDIFFRHPYMLDIICMASPILRSSKMVYQKIRVDY